MPKKVQFSQIWLHFTSLPETQKKRCNHCDQEFGKSTSTSTLWAHAKAKHGISKPSVTENSEENANENSTKTPGIESGRVQKASSNTIRDVIAKNTHQTKIQTSIKKQMKFAERIARMAALDNLSFRQIASSTFIQDSLEMMYQRRAKSHNTVSKIVKKFAAEKRAEVKSKISETLKMNGRFSFTCDEYTSAKNTRFMNVNLHQYNNHYNLGMVHIPGSLKSEKAAEIVTKRAKDFGLGKQNWQKFRENNGFTNKTTKRLI